MKNHKIYRRHFICLSLFLPVLTSCQTAKLLNRQKEKVQVAAQKTILMDQEQQILLNHHRQISFSDSSDQTYQISIVPIDSFSFSIQDGFKGRAQSIEISGIQQIRKHLSDSSAESLESHRSEKANIISKNTREQSTNLKAKEKESRMMSSKTMLILLGLMILVAGGWWWRRN